MNFTTLVKKASAFVPLLLSAAALALVGVVITVFGVVREPDEGTAAHLWQLLMAAQVPFIAVFAVTWLPRAPRPAFIVLALQAAAAIAAMLPVCLLGL
jgi:glucan phosphoethanolaminetransferase (alkaline phosphatase superfamily)